MRKVERLRIDHIFEFYFSVCHQCPLGEGTPSVLIISPSDLDTVIDMKKECEDIEMKRKDRNKVEFLNSSQ